jgi:hypothetical protein
VKTNIDSLPDEILLQSESLRLQILESELTVSLRQISIEACSWRLAQKQPAATARHALSFAFCKWSTVLLGC